MKYSKILNRIVFSILMITLLCSCEKKADEFSNSIQQTYYLSAEKKLSPNPVSDGDWIYITNYIYPEGVTKSCEWSLHLNHNISKDEYGYDILFWSASQSMVRIDFILLKGTQETILASDILDVPYVNDSTAIQCKTELLIDPLKGINPKTGKDQDLVFRITQVSGTDNVAIFFDSNSGSFGCSSIAFYMDQ